MRRTDSRPHSSPFPSLFAFGRGVLNSTTADWRPGGGGLLERVMDSRACGDVDVVVVLVGLQDVLRVKDAATLAALAVSDW